MYLDKSQKVDFPKPHSLQEAIDNIDRYYYANDDLHFTMWLEDVEALAKQCRINGSITDKQMNIIFERYGLR